MNTYVTKIREKTSRLRVWPWRDVREIVLKAERKFVPEKLIVTFCGYGPKMGKGLIKTAYC